MSATVTYVVGVPCLGARVAYVLGVPGSDVVCVDVRTCSLQNWPAIRALFDWGPAFHQIGRAWIVGSLI